MKKFNSISLVLLSVIVFFSACSQNNKVTSPESVGISSDTLLLADKKLQEYIDEGKLAGISTMVVKNGVVVQNEYYGYADLESKKPVDEHTLFRIFSMTKPVTSVALMTLYDEGKFKLDDKLSSYIPEFRDVKVYTRNDNGFTLEPQENEMSIRHLLTHTSGITYGWDPNSYVDSLYRITNVGDWDSTTIGDKVKKLAELPLKHQPGTTYEYSLSIDVAGYLVEVISGMPLDEFFRIKILDPLKMNHTGFYVPEDHLESFAQIYSVDSVGELQVNGFISQAFKRPTIQFWGGAGLVSNLSDYTRFCRMLLNGGELDGVRILKEETVTLIMSDQSPEGVSFWEDTSYGLGGSVNLKTGEYSWGGAAATKFWIDPKNDMVIVTYTQLMPSNDSYAKDFKDIVLRALM